MARLIVLEREEDIRFLKELIRRYHAQGCPSGGAMSKRQRFYVYEIEGYWCAGMWIHGSEPFRFIAQRHRIPIDTSWFIRRVCRFCPIDCLVDFITAVAKELREEGWECIWTLGLPSHSNALYRRAGFEEVGKSPRTGHPIFVKWLR